MLPFSDFPFSPFHFLVITGGGSSNTLVGSSVLYQSGDTAVLPCDISVPVGSETSRSDELVLVMWYREDVRSPIYSIGEFLNQ